METFNEKRNRMEEKTLLERHYTSKCLFLILKTTKTIRSIKKEDLGTKKNLLKINFMLIKYLGRSYKLNPRENLTQTRI